MKPMRFTSKEVAHLWAIFFAGVVSLQYHPKNSPAERLSMEDCGIVADQMLAEYRKRVYKEDPLCRG